MMCQTIGKSYRIRQYTDELQQTRSECVDPYIYHIASCILFFIDKITLYLHVFDSLKLKGNDFVSKMTG